jgi:8-oxo-dGTP diphosphatase
MRKHVKNEIKHLAEIYGQPEIIKVALPTGLFEPMLHKERDGEVVGAILRPNDKLIAITKPFYPKGTYRFPSGGIEVGESIEEALYREIHEETNLIVEIAQYVAIVQYTVEASPRHFTSHVFLVKEKGGKLACVDEDEQISEYREIDLEDLQKIIAHLENLGGEFSEYGTFRAVPHKAVLNALRDSQK